ncbi:hypothetical protein BP6252_12631 [Coleophoma cylindrospora]|uniref:Heterokaryon incompatibility domain-containing protein n=1 Tax=Coleophoma cylindrospora TaxID=1849047 RepID=A0A3D8QDN8_9HELO|nr:hypothetical protein BP6252_12631 [Coleophoma cylindrospora]
MVHPIFRYHQKLQNNSYSKRIVDSFKIWNASGLEVQSRQLTIEGEFRLEGMQVGTIDEVCDPCASSTTREPEWLRLAYQHLGTEYQTPTMSCHILQAYFRTILGGHYEPANKRLPDFKGRFALASAFWDWFRGPFAPELQSMRSSGSIDQLLLGETSANGIRVESGDYYHGFLTASFCKFQSLHFFVTSNGYIGYGPECQPDDIVSVVFGCSVPLILRPQQKGYIILGQCFVLGVMNGELLEDYGDKKGSEKIGDREVFDIL